jgi:protein phosphatase
VLLLVLGAAAGAIGFYARGAYYVGVDEGRVTIFQGRPGGLLWFSPTVKSRSSLTAAELPEARADDVNNGHEFANLDDARTFVRKLESEASATATTTTGDGTPTTTSTTTTTAPATATTAATATAPTTTP